MKIRVAFAAMSALLCATPLAASDAPTPGYNTHIPPEIMTPERVETRIGTLKFSDGRPTPETTRLLYDNLDFMRGVEVFLNFIPAASLEAMRRGNASLGQDAPHKVIVMTELLDSTPLFLTGNTDTVYASTFFDLQKDGAMVVEIPAGMGPSTVNDAFFRFVTDMGAPGPDKGKGGKYLILPPDYKGNLDPPEGGYKAEVRGEAYFVSKSKSYVNWFIARGFLVDSKTDAAVKAFRNGLRIYPLSKKEKPPAIQIIKGSGVPFNTIHANTYPFYEEIDAVIQREPVSMLDPELRGLAAAIGIEKGKRFAPDVRMKKILTEAVAVGNGTARAIWLDTRNDESLLYKDRSWRTAFVGGNYKWLSGKDGAGGRNLDARTLFFYMATVNTPAMVLKIPGVGSQYAANYVDANGTFLDGSKTYKLNIPANVPAKDFWSVVAYDPQTRSELQTSQPFPSKNNKRDRLEINKNGSVDIYFGPAAPKGKEGNWVKTVPSKGWFVILRLYGPTKAWFDKTWKPGNIELFEG